MKKRIAKALAGAGIGSRRSCEKLIFEGCVEVNGKVCDHPSISIDLQNDKVMVNGKKITATEEKVVYLLHKPRGYLCSNQKIRKNDRLVVDLFSETGLRLFSVGRLDKETTGLLLVTNDGVFANHVTHPSFGIEKEYLAKVAEEVEDRHLKSISRGIEIEGKKVTPLRVTKIRKGTLKVVTGDGKKREVRLLLEAAGLTIHSLCRIRIGGLVLGNIPEGSYRPLTEKEKNLILKR